MLAFKLNRIHRFSVLLSVQILAMFNWIQLLINAYIWMILAWRFLVLLLQTHRYAISTLSQIIRQTGFIVSGMALPVTLFHLISWNVASIMAIRICAMPTTKIKFQLILINVSIVHLQRIAIQPKEILAAGTSQPKMTAYNSFQVPIYNLQSYANGSIINANNCNPILVKILMINIPAHK